MGKIKRIKWKDGDFSEWENQRKEMEGVGLDYDYVRIGASDISVVTGTNRWKEKRRLFMHLTGEYSNFQLSETTVSGHLLEEVIVKRWESYDKDDQQAGLTNTLRGIKVRNLEKARFFLLNSDYPDFFISLDYIPDGEQYSPFTGELYHELTPHELKHTNYNYFCQWENGITKAYYDQIQTQMLLTNTDLAVFHVLVDGVKYHVKEFARDQKRIDEIVAEVKAFCKLVRDGKDAYRGMLTAPTEEMREAFKNIYENMLPPFEGMKDGVALADELWLPSEAIDKDVNFKIASKKEDQMMHDYYSMLRLEEQVCTNKQMLQATLKTASSKWEGIKSDRYKLISRGINSVKGKYFSIKPIKEKAPKK